MRLIYEGNMYLTTNINKKVVKNNNGICYIVFCQYLPVVVVHSSMKESIGQAILSTCLYFVLERKFQRDSKKNYKYFVFCQYLPVVVFFSSMEESIGQAILSRRLFRAVTEIPTR